MTKINTIKIFFLTLMVILTGCGDSTVILKNRDFSNGDWLLVNSDGNKKTQFVIDDEKVLQENSNGIKVRFSKEDQYTTCDGQLQLFKDGKLVAEQLYLDPPCLTGPDLAAAIRSGNADCGIATRAVARAAGLDFVPLVWENFDLLLRQRSYFRPPIQALIRFFASARLRARAAELTGYDVSPAGQIRFAA